MEWISDTFLKGLGFCKSMAATRYVSPRLVIPDKSSTDQRLYIRWQAFDVLQQKVRVFKCYQINDYRKHSEFDAICKELCRQIEHLLASGCVYDPTRAEIQQVLEPEVAEKRKEEEQTLFSALSAILVTKSIFKTSTYKSYKDAVRKLKGYLTSQNRDKMLVKDFKLIDCQNFSMFILKFQGLSNRTHNNCINALKSIWNAMMDLEMVEINPWNKLSKPSSGKGRNVAFNEVQQRELIDYMKSKESNMLRLSLFMYYTGCRTTELAHLQIKDIYSDGPDKIHISRLWAKNSMMRQVVVHPALAELIEQWGWLNCPKEYYIFSIMQKPGPVMVSPEQFGKNFRRKVLAPLKYPKQYTLYSWRHTFAVMGYRAGMTVAELGMQLGHQDPGSTNAYLKSLGLFSNDAVKEKLPSLQI